MFPTQIHVLIKGLDCKNLGLTYNVKEETNAVFIFDYLYHICMSVPLCVLRALEFVAFRTVLFDRLHSLYTICVTFMHMLPLYC